MSSQEIQSSPKQAQYERDGFYIHAQPVLPPDVVEQAIAGMDAVRAGHYDTGRPPRPSPWSPGDDPHKLCKIEMPHLASRGILELVSHPALGQLAAEVTGAEMVQVWWVQLLYKPPTPPGAQSRTNVGWHQDRQYWQEWGEESQLFTAWVALSEVSAESGPMHFVRGSHRWGFLGQGDFFEQDTEAQREQIPVPEGESWEEVAAILAPGGVSFHDNLTLHGSGPNVSGGPRRSFAIHLRTEKANPRPGIERHQMIFTAHLDDLSHCPVIYGRL
jgi:ectoine hydroxylase-related dioxygenase (phytanoyl-CoA dioxygenase family)